MDEEEEEGRRTVEDKYMEPTAHFASISLVTPPLDAHKIIHLFTLCLHFLQLTPSPLC
jgi:hypothetical protein